MYLQDKNKTLDDTPPFFDFSPLKSRTFQIILLSSFVSSFGLFTPLIILVSCYFFSSIKEPVPRKDWTRYGFTLVTSQVLKVIIFSVHNFVHLLLNG
jgi:hypothetical protein